eukprot:scaffold111951_cov54-Attheya_sp.AAC.3
MMYSAIRSPFLCWRGSHFAFASTYCYQQVRRTTYRVKKVTCVVPSSLASKNRMEARTDDVTTQNTTDARNVVLFASVYDLRTRSLEPRAGGDEFEFEKR